MRILHVSTRLILGGSQENTVLSCEGQARLGHDVHLAFGPIYGPEGSLLERVEAFCVGGETTRTEPPAQAGGPSGGAGEQGRDPQLALGALKESRITTHVVPSLIRAINPVADVRCYFQLKRLMRTLKPDIVHTHSSKAGIIGRAAAWRVCTRSKTGRPAIIHTIHGPPFHRYQSRLTNLVYVISERFAARRCHTIVAVADAMTSQYLARNIGEPRQYTTVRSGIETEPFLNATAPENRARIRRELNLDEHDFVIGTVARLAELKGHDDLLDALGDDLRGNPHWKLLWVGDGWWKDRLLGRVSSLGLEKQVVTTGLVPPERVPDMIAAMDILVHPSYREGLPRTVVQALLCGVCPIAYEVDGTGEVCQDMVTGRLVPPGDIQRLGDAIRWAAQHRDEREVMAKHGQAMCRNIYSAETMVQELEKVYADALECA